MEGGEVEAGRERIQERGERKIMRRAEEQARYTGEAEIEIEGANKQRVIKMIQTKRRVDRSSNMECVVV